MFLRRLRARHVLLFVVPLAGGAAVLAPRRPLPLPRPPLPTYLPHVPPKVEPVASLSIPRTRIADFLRDYIWEPLCIAKRFAHLVLIFLPVILTSPMLLVGRRTKTGDRWGAVWWYGILVKHMEAAGPTFIKVCGIVLLIHVVPLILFFQLSQWAASRVDLFPPLLCSYLGALHSQGTPHPMSHTRRVIEDVFRRPFEEVFEQFEETPIGSGAIAQVYRATLKQDLIPPSYHNPRRTRKPLTDAVGPVILQDPPPSVPTASVAIKILHPRVAQVIERDLSIMKFFATCISVLPGMKWLSLPDEVRVFGEMMRQQLDLRHEADNLLTFEANFAPRRVPITFPRPLRSWSTPNMLIEEYQNALPLELFLRNGGGRYDFQIATVGLNAFLVSLLSRLDPPCSHRT